MLVYGHHMPATTSNYPQPGTPVTAIAPIYVTAKDAAAILGGGTSPWTIHRLCRLGAIESRFQGKRRMVSLSSLREYAESLPTERDEVAS